MSGRAGRTALVTMAVGAGLALGWLAARRGLGRFREDLFHPRALRRLAALRHLGQRAEPDHLGLLRDYLAWEPRPALRRQAAGLVRRLEARLG